MADDQLTVAVSRAIYSLFSSASVHSPISSLSLLSACISHGLPSGPSRTPPSLRLTDLSRFETVLEDLARHWDHGLISVTRGNEGFTIMDVQLGSGSDASGRTIGKRKRVRDEEADSAAGSGEETEDLSEDVNSPVTALASLSKELKEVYTSLQRSTSKSRLLAEQFRSLTSSFEPVCTQVTKDDCLKARAALSTPLVGICDRVHFRPLIRPHTDPSLGHCSYLNTCYSEPTYANSPSIPPLPSSQGQQGNWPKPQLPSGLGAGGRGKEKAPCRYLHYEIDWDPVDTGRAGEGRKVERMKRKPHRLAIGLGPEGRQPEMLSAQWINCDLRRFDYSVLGKFHVIMADPPWDIHMSLPYGTMTDDEMRAMPIPMLQDEGLLFLWVTGRAMEVGRECLRVWGYTRVDEVVWVKTNQLQRVIRTGRTGHWLNHTKEHMLVGVKTHYDSAGNLKFPAWVNRGVDTDVIVSEVRETSRKPDEAYGLIERMCPGGRKIEIFGRKHNTRPGWLTLGNQLGGDQIYEEDLAARIKDRYPERASAPSVTAAASQPTNVQPRR
ncbi:MT-A70-domain-containing protein [Auriscalpium vulgare]|uniref:MT-A70-domain-containing protein n=1 Tax=Auriscalpium vulgare TaxID=40419 RepID=A0ACB8R9D3_9AGAM|nr:MT-A70-domain-containing protein [Auriscalpium vulgare]